MKSQKQLVAWRKRAQLITIAALPIFAFAPFAARSVNAEMVAAEADAGPGTDFVACQNTAWADYNSCLMHSGEEWERKLCDIAFQADVVWCGSVYWRRVKTGV